MHVSRWGGIRKVYKAVARRNEEKHFGDIGVYERIILERISNEQDMGVYTGLISLKIRSTGEVLSAWFHKNLDKISTISAINNSPRTTILHGKKQIPTLDLLRTLNNFSQQVNWFPV